MKQSTILFGSLIFAFFFYITVKGQLAQYMSLFTGAPSAPVNETKDSAEINSEKESGFDSFMKNFGVEF
jgi:hypothetical protein